MQPVKVPDEYSPNRDPNFKYPDKFKMPEDYDFDLSSNQLIRYRLGKI